MRKVVLSIALFAFTKGFAQSGMILNSRDFAEGSTFSGIISSKNSGRSLSYDDIVGSPYSNVNFSSAKIAENYELTPVRYNSYTDQIEFKKDDDIMVLPKQFPFERIEFLSPKQILVLLKTNDDFEGYFYEIIRGDKATLYKKIQTKFIDIVPASNTYSSDKPATFKTGDPIYYIKALNGFVKKPKNIKEIVDLFPDKKDSLTSLFKNNKLRLQKEEDLKKIVDLINN